MIPTARQKGHTPVVRRTHSNRRAGSSSSDALSGSNSAKPGLGDALLADRDFQFQHALERLANTPQGGDYSEEGQSTTANDRSVVNEHGEFGIVAFNQFGLDAEFALEHSRRPGGLDTRHSVAAASYRDSHHSSMIASYTPIRCAAALAPDDVVIPRLLDAHR